jgi:hypothetical protein
MFATNQCQNSARVLTTAQLINSWHNSTAHQHLHKPTTTGDDESTADQKQDESTADTSPTANLQLALRMCL